MQIEKRYPKLLSELFKFYDNIYRAFNGKVKITTIIFTKPQEFI